MKKPLASCVCVTFDRPQLVKELLYCFLAQDYENKELIIINDQKDIIYLYNDPRVKIYNLQVRFPSLGAKRNYSRKTTNGDFIFTMDDDDLYYSNHISKLLNFHLKNPEADIVADYDQEYSEWNDGKHIIQNLGCSFNGSCISKEYWLKNDFPNNKSCGEDKDYIQGANIMHIKGETTFHYRWGLDIWHISGMGGDGQESYGLVTKNTPVGEKRFIQLIPELSEKAQVHYR